MKKLVAVFVVMILSAALLTGCIPMAILEKALEEEDAVKEFQLEEYGISITAPGEWEETDQDNFDMQLYNGEAYFSMYAYYTIDMAAADTPESIYELQNDDIFSRRDNVEIVEAPVTYNNNGKTITRTLYSAERDGSKNYYCCCLITFDDNDEVFAWVVVTAKPSTMISDIDAYMEIVESMQAGMGESI